MPGEFSQALLIGGWYNTISVDDSDSYAWQKLFLSRFGGIVQVLLELGEFGHIGE
jgi:hypothetical protein